MSALTRRSLERVEVALVALFFAQLFLDGLELLAQHVLALVLAHLLFDLRVDALTHLQDLELSGEQPEHLPDALLGIDGLEELRLFVDGRVEVGGDEVRQLTRLLDGVDERARLAGQLGHQLDDLLRDVAKAHREGLGLDVLSLGLVESRNARPQIGRHLPDVLHADSHQPLEDQTVVAGAVLERFENARGNAHGIEIRLSRVVGRRIALRKDRDDRLAQVLDVFDQSDGFLAAHVEGSDGAGEEDRVADGEDG